MTCFPVADNDKARDSKCSNPAENRERGGRAEEFLSVLGVFLSPPDVLKCFQLSICFHFLGYCHWRKMQCHPCLPSCDVRREIVKLATTPISFFLSPVKPFLSLLPATQPLFSDFFYNGSDYVL